MDPTVTTVMLEAGTYLLHSSIVVPSGKSLIGAGRDQTLLRAADDFAIISPAENSVVISRPGATDITLSDFAVDAAKVSPEGLRLNGVFMKFATDFDISRVDVSNATGYAHFAQGDLNGYFGGRAYIQASGTYNDCVTYNSQVHFEQMFADGITLTNVHARDGDGTISTEAYFHALVGSKNISYVDSTAYGKGFLGFSLLSSSLPLDNISITNCDIEITDPSTGSALIALGNLPIFNLDIDSSNFIANNYIAFRIGGVTGTATDSRFQGHVMGMQVTTSGNSTPSSFTVVDSIALGLGDPKLQTGIAGVHSDQADFLTWSGGSIEARGGLMFPISGRATVSPETELVSAGFDTVATYVENTAGLAILAGKTLDVSAATSLDGTILRVDFQAHGASDDRLSIRESGPLAIDGAQLAFEGTTIATIEGGVGGEDLLIHLNAAASVAALQQIVGAISYRNISDTPFTKARPVLVSLETPTGVLADLSASITVQAVDDAPLLRLDNPASSEPFTYTENGAPVLLASDATISDIDSTALPGGRLKVSVTDGFETGDRLTVPTDRTFATGIFQAGQSVFHNSAPIGTVIGNTNGALEILLTSGASLEAVQALVRSIGFSSSSDNPGAQSRQIGFELKNSTVPAATIPSASALIVPIDDAATAVGDRAIVSESGSVEFDLLANDIDPDQRLDSIMRINGADLAIGDSLALPSGAVVTLISATQVRYDPNGAFNALAAPGSGTTYTSVADRFTYGLSSDSEALVHVSVTGEASPEDILRGNAAANVLTGNEYGQSILGLEGDDTLFGAGGDDILDGGLGNDLLDGGAGIDRLVGGSGNDRYDVDAENDAIIEQPGDGTDNVFSSALRFVLPAHVENLSFSGDAGRFYGVGNDLGNVLSGGKDADFLIGLVGDDTLRGGNGADLLDGGEGNDILDGGDGGDAMIGGIGSDVYRVDSPNDAIVEGVDSGWDTVNVSISSYTLPDGVENLNYSGPGGAFTAQGNALQNSMLGSSGSDTLFGLAGNDTLYGFGGSDTLHGGDGNDKLYGGLGSDILSGGSGADNFYFDTVNASGGNIDTIADFVAGEDTLLLRQAIFPQIAAGPLAASAYGVGQAASNADHRIIYDPAAGFIFYDPDGSGSGGQIHFATVTPGTALTEGDFVLFL